MNITVFFTSESRRPVGSCPAGSEQKWLESWNEQANPPCIYALFDRRAVAKVRSTFSYRLGGCRQRTLGASLFFLRVGNKLTRLFLFQKRFFCGSPPHQLFVKKLVWGYSNSMKSFDIEQAKKVAETVTKKYGLSFVALFGSQATGRAHEHSNTDIGVAKCSASYFEELFVPNIEIEGEFSRVLIRNDIKVVNLSTASPTIMRTVVSEGIVLYETHPNAFFEWKLFAMKVWRDTAWLRNLQNPEMCEKWIKSGFSRRVAMNE